LIALAAVILIPLFIFVGGEVVMRLWNWLLPALFGWRMITFWQAVGVLALCRILFGRIGGRPHYRPNFRRHMAERWQERWERMTPEEREKLRQGWRSRCGHTGAPTTEAKA
jgi:hypothetical protein